MGAARHRVAADLRRLRLPAGLPDRAVRPRRQDRHPLRGHHRDPGPGLLLPQDRQGPGPGARPPGAARSRRSSRARPATAGSRSSASCSATALEDAQAIVGAHDQRPDGADASAEGGDVRNIYKVGLEHHPPADGARRRRLRLAAAARRPRSRWTQARRASVGARTRRSTRARSPPRSSSPSQTCRSSPPSARSPRPPTSSLMDLDEAAF